MKNYLGILLVLFLSVSCEPEIEYIYIEKEIIVDNSTDEIIDESKVKFVFYTTPLQEPNRDNSNLYINSTDWQLIIDNFVFENEFITIDSTVTYIAYNFDYMDEDHFFINILFDSMLVIDDRFNEHELGIGKHEAKIKRSNDMYYEQYGRYPPLISKFNVVANDSNGLPEYVIRYFPELNEPYANGFLTPYVIDTIKVTENIIIPILVNI